MMKLLVLVCCAAFASVGSSPISSPRIIGGGGTPGEHYTVSVQSSGRHICGGSILTPSPKTPQGKNFILTAAHCVYGLENTNLKVLVGTTKLTEGENAPTTRQVLQVTKKKIHDNFDIFDLLNDIAVLEVGEIKGIGTDIKPVTLATVAFPGGPNGYEFSGWGLNTEGKQPNEVQTLSEVTPLANCDKGVNQLCAKSTGTTPQGACNGDAGGPLLERKIEGSETVASEVQAGILSYGYGCAKGNEDVFTNVIPYTEFINDIVDGKTTGT